MSGKAWKFPGDPTTRSRLASLTSFLVTTLFLGYNLVMGLRLHSVWYFSISVYYFVLLVLRGLILLCARSWRGLAESARLGKKRRMYCAVTRILIAMDVSLVVPIFLMVLSARPVHMGMIPAIAVATYTTYKVTAAIIGYCRARGQQDLTLLSLRIVNGKDAAVSILTLQNTLVAVFGEGKSMLTLTAYTSAGMLLAMVSFTALSIRAEKRREQV